ncbi:MAG TPA: hypothetical protein HA224_01065 [Nanoarchaeota archaeon]|nr:hypothetical protein [Nanoarchaeota archaeon]
MNKKQKQIIFFLTWLVIWAMATMYEPFQETLQIVFAISIVFLIIGLVLKKRLGL